MPKASVNLKETDRRTLINGCVGKKEAWFPARAADASVRFCLAVQPGLPWVSRVTRAQMRIIQSRRAVLAELNFML